MGNLGKIIVAKALKSCPNCNKSPNLVTLVLTDRRREAKLRTRFWRKMKLRQNYFAIIFAITLFASRSLALDLASPRNWHSDIFLIKPQFNHELRVV